MGNIAKKSVLLLKTQLVKTASPGHLQGWLPDQSPLLQPAPDKTRPPLGKVPFRVPVPGKAALKLGGGGGLNRCTESAAPLRGLFLSPQEQTAHKARWFPSAGCIQCTSSHRREPFCPPPTPPFQASTTGPFCSAAGNNLLLPSCSEVTFCP